MKPHRTLRTLVAMALLVAMLLTSATAFASEFPRGSELRESIAIYASFEDFLGIPYVYRGSSTKGFDCSGFVYYVYAQFGFTLERSTSDQKNMGTKIENKEDLLLGDLVFFRNYHHVGIYIGNGNFVHASSGKGKVIISSLEEGYYCDKYSGARRIF